MEPFTIRKAEGYEVKSFFEWAEAEGWNLSLHDGYTFNQEFPQGWFIAEIDDGKRPVGKLYATKYVTGIGIIGYLIVKKEFRCKGFGYQLLKHSLENFLDKDPSCCAVALYSAIEEVPYYAKFGFKVHSQIARFKLDSNTEIFNRTRIEHSEISISVMDPTGKDLEDVSQYDKKLSGAYRPGFWSMWGSQLSKEYCIICRDSDTSEIIGLGALRPLMKGMKLGPLYAKDKKIATIILTRLCQSLEKNSEIRTDCLESTKEATELLQEFGFIQFATAYFMWRGNPNEIISSDNNVFCVNSLDFN